MISWALSLIINFSGVTLTPTPSKYSISSNKAFGSTTTPLPITFNLSSYKIPDGIKCNLYSLSPTTTVWPALFPPWNLTTTLASSAK